MPSRSERANWLPPPSKASLNAVWIAIGVSSVSLPRGVHVRPPRGARIKFGEGCSIQAAAAPGQLTRRSAAVATKSESERGKTNLFWDQPRTSRGHRPRLLPRRSIPCADVDLVTRPDRVGQAGAVIDQPAVDINREVPAQSTLVVEHIAAQCRARREHRGERGTDRGALHRSRGRRQKALERPGERDRRHAYCPASSAARRARPCRSILLVPASGISGRNHTRRGCR